jgi:hypothetical protein
MRLAVRRHPPPRLSLSLRGVSSARSSFLKTFSRAPWAPPAAVPKVTEDASRACHFTTVRLDGNRFNRTAHILATMSGRGVAV